MTVRKREYRDSQNIQIWDYDFWYNGKRFRKAGFGSKAEAEIAETRAKQLVYSGKTILRPSTFQDLVEPFWAHRECRVAPKTFENDQRRMPILVGHFGKKPIPHVTTGDVEHFIDCRRRDKKKATTINLDINLLSSIFQFAVAQGYAYENPVRSVKRLKTEQVERTIPSVDQFRSLVEGARKAEAGLELSTWITFRGYTGTRPTESFFTEWRDIDFVRNQITIRSTKSNRLKNGKSRVLPLHPELKAALLIWKQAWDERFAGMKKTHDWIFFNHRFPHRQCRSFRKTYIHAQKFAGLTEHMTSHCIRHFFISMAVECGINFLVIAQWVGHSSIKMIQEVYAHLSPDFKNSEMQKLQLGIGNGSGDRAADGTENQTAPQKKVDSEGA